MSNRDDHTASFRKQPTALAFWESKTAAASATPRNATGGPSSLTDFATPLANSKAPLPDLPTSSPENAMPPSDPDHTFRQASSSRHRVQKKKLLQMKRRRTKKAGAIASTSGAITDGSDAGPSSSAASSDDSSDGDDDVQDGDDSIDGGGEDVPTSIGTETDAALEERTRGLAIFDDPHLDSALTSSASASASSSSSSLPQNRSGVSLSSGLLSNKSLRRISDSRPSRASSALRHSLSQDAVKEQVSRASESSDTQSFYDAADATDESPDLVQSPRFVGDSQSGTDDDVDQAAGSDESWLHLHSRKPQGSASSSTLRQDNLRASGRTFSPNGARGKSQDSATSISEPQGDSLDLPTTADRPAETSSFLPSPPTPAMATFQQFAPPPWSVTPRKQGVKLPPARPLPGGPLPPTPSEAKRSHSVTASHSTTSESLYTTTGTSDDNAFTDSTGSESNLSRLRDGSVFDSPLISGHVPQHATFPPSPTTSAADSNSILSLPSSVGSLAGSLAAFSDPNVSRQTSRTSSLSPNGIIRGRPRGATVGAVPSSSSRNSYLAARPANNTRSGARPRSLLSHELVLPPVAPSPHALPVSRMDSIYPSGSSIDPATFRSDGSSSVGGDSIASARTSISLGTGQDGSYTDSSNGQAAAAEGENRDHRLNGSETGTVASLPASNIEERRPPGATTRSRSGSTASVLLQQVQHPKSHANFVIAVVGHRGSGKSTVIKKGLRQFGLSKPQVLSEKVTSHSTVCIVDHEQRIIEVLEIDTSILLNGPKKRFSWPKFLPHIDAVILCYDASNLSSFRGMSELLENFAISNLSTVMLACKSEIQPKAVDPYYASELAGVYNVGLAECAVQSEEGKKRMRDCFSYLVKEVAKARAGRARSRPTGTTTSSEASSANSSRADGISALPPQRGSADSSTMPLQRARAGSVPPVRPSMTGPTTTTAGLVMSKDHDSQQSGGPDTLPRVPMSLTGSQSTNSVGSRNVSGSTVRSEPASTTGDSVAGEASDMAQDSIERAQFGLQSAKSVGGYVTLDKLWDKLFFAAVTGTEERFLLMFMVFYRGFVRPVELLRQMISRFDSLAQREQKDTLIRFSLLRLTAMLGDWMQDYPGDLSGSETWPLLCDFFDRLCRHPTTMHIALPLRPLLEDIKVAPDLDAAWSKDQDSSKPKSVAAEVPPVGLELRPEALPELPAKMSRDMNNSRDRSHSDASSVAVQSTASDKSDAPSIGNEVETPAKPGRTKSDPTVNESHQTSSAVSHGTGSASPAPSSPAAQLPSALPTPAPEPTNFETWTHEAQPTTLKEAQEQKLRLKAASTALAEMDDVAIASELTRLEWDLFIAIRPRDLLRHILSSREARPKDGTVARSIAFFNYVSHWVASMIVVQSKTKIRAKMLEKFTNIASILRHDNNYNTLQAVLAGLGNSAVHRLKTAQSMINKSVQKAYLSLLRLMGSDRSFAAYRLALENSDGRTIPYLGVHLQDILSMSDGNPSKRASDEMVHWRKFSLMDESVMAMVHCQQWTNPLPPPKPGVERHILNLPLFDEEGLYSRSLLVEPRGSHNTSSSLPGSRILSKYLNTNHAAS